jgi:hypothetical protein
MKRVGRKEVDVGGVLSEGEVGEYCEGLQELRITTLHLMSFT